MNEAEAEFLELFRDEANERLDNMVDTLLALESGRAAPEALDSLFRDAHTVKGTFADMIQITKLLQVITSLETP